MECQAVIAELCMLGGRRSAYVACDPAAIPGPGRYLLAHQAGSQAPLATELFAAEYRSNGFVAAPPVPKEWSPGCELNLRGPLGTGFEVPSGSRRVALIAFNNDPARLSPLIELAINQQAAVALVCEDPPSEWPLQLEVQPLRALAEVCRWSDYAAFDIEGRSLAALEEALMPRGRLELGSSAQALVRVPMPCGGLAECGVCTVRTTSGRRLACVDGPVFDVQSLFRKS